MTPPYADRLAAFQHDHPVLIECDVRGSNWTGSRIPSNGKPCDCCGTYRLKWLWPVADMEGTVYLIGEDCWKNLREAGQLIILSHEEEIDFPRTDQLKSPYYGRPTYLYQEAANVD